MEDWTAIAAEASEAIADVGFIAILTRQVAPAPATPWAAEPIERASFPLTVVDMGIRAVREAGEIVRRRVLLVAEDGYVAPEIGDMIEVRGVSHAVMSVTSTAPGGVDVMHRVELKV